MFGPKNAGSTKCWFQNILGPTTIKVQKYFDCIIFHKYIRHKNFNYLRYLIFIKIHVLFCCHNPNSTSTQLKSWVWHENDFNPPLPPPITHTNSMSAISQLLLTWFQPNFKVRFLGWTTTITKTTTTLTTILTTRHQQHLIYYRPDFNLALKIGF